MNQLSHITAAFRSDLDRYYAQADAAERHEEAVDIRADAIATSPDLEQFADVFCGMGTGAGEIEKLRAAWLNGKAAFMAEVMEQMNAGFTALADLEIEREYHNALECNAHEVLSDWE